MVPFTKAIKNFYVKSFDFNGRATRAEYWWVRLYLFISLIVLILLFPSIIFGAFILIHIVPSISLQARRYHDVGEPGSTLFLIIAGFAFCAIFTSAGFPVATLGILGKLLIIIYQLILNCTHGQKRDNEYGYNPYGNTHHPTNTNYESVENVEL